MDEISILFINEAEKLLDIGKYSAAVEVCLNGLDKFPEYPTGYTVLIKSVEKLGDIKLARLYLDDAIERFPFNKSFKLMKNQFEITHKIIEKSGKHLKLKEEIGRAHV